LPFGFRHFFDMNEMHDHIDDELLSAYIDDELTVEERALVEARLASDPAAAQLVEELRRVSGAVRSLPREKMSRDLRASVLAGLRAEGEEGAAVLKLPYRGADRWEGVKRGLVWSSIAIAATLMLMAMQPRERGDADVADRAKQEESRRADGALADGRARRVRRSDEVPSFRAPAAVETESAESPAAGEGQAGAMGGGGGRASEADDRRELRGAEAPATAPAMADEAKESPSSPMGESLADKSAAPASAPTPAAPAAPPAAPDGNVSSLSASAPGGGVAASAREGGMQAGEAQSFAGGRRAGLGADRGGGADRLEEKKDELTRVAELQVVELELGGAQADSIKEFERALADNGIAVSDLGLTVGASGGDVDAVGALTSGDAILVRASGRQLERMLEKYAGQVVGGSGAQVADSFKADLAAQQKRFYGMQFETRQRQLEVLADAALRAEENAGEKAKSKGPAEQLGDASGRGWRLHLAGGAPGAAGTAGTPMSRDAAEPARALRSGEAAAPPPAASEAPTNGENRGKLGFARSAGSAQPVLVLFVLRPSAGAMKKAAN
jgi:hypothetical protein